jgi:hypothetical protein
MALQSSRLTLSFLRECNCQVPESFRIGALVALAVAESALQQQLLSWGDSGSLDIEVAFISDRTTPGVRAMETAMPPLLVGPQLHQISRDFHAEGRLDCCIIWFAAKSDAISKQKTCSGRRDCPCSVVAPSTNAAERSRGLIRESLNRLSLISREEPAWHSLCAVSSIFHTPYTPSTPQTRTTLSRDPRS